MPMPMSRTTSYTADLAAAAWTLGGFRYSIRAPLLGPCSPRCEHCALEVDVVEGVVCLRHVHPDGYETALRIELPPGAAAVPGGVVHMMGAPLWVQHRDPVELRVPHVLFDRGWGATVALCASADGGDGAAWAAAWAALRGVALELVRDATAAAAAALAAATPLDVATATDVAERAALAARGWSQGATLFALMHAHAAACRLECASSSAPTSCTGHSRAASACGSSTCATATCIRATASASATSTSGRWSWPRPEQGGRKGRKGPVGGVEPSVRMLSVLPPHVVALIGACPCLAARDRASLACAARGLSAAHEAVVEDDVSDDCADAALPGAGDGRVAGLLRAAPRLRTLRMHVRQHGGARSFLALGGGRTVQFACEVYAGTSCAAWCDSLARDFPGCVGVDAVMLSAPWAAQWTASTRELLRHLTTVGQLVIAPGSWTSSFNERIQDAMRAFVSSTPFKSIRSVHLVHTSASETLALLALLPVPLDALCFPAFKLSLLGPLLAEVGRRPPDQASALLARLRGVHVRAGHWVAADGVGKSHKWSQTVCHAVFAAMDALAALPADCMVRFDAELCRNELAAPLLLELLDHDGGRREAVEIVCSDRRAPVSTWVQATLACVENTATTHTSTRIHLVDPYGSAIDRPPQGTAAALERMRADPDAAGNLALWKRMGLRAAMST
jgi:hypothetical protein